MLDYSKVVELIKKELPSATQEEIDYMISTIPSSMPYPVVKSMIKLTKHLIDNPAKRKLLKSQIGVNHQEKETPGVLCSETVPKDASCGTRD